MFRKKTTEIISQEESQDRAGEITETDHQGVNFIALTYHQVRSAALQPFHSVHFREI